MSQEGRIIVRIPIPVICLLQTPSTWVGVFRVFLGWKKERRTMKASLSSDAWFGVGTK